MTYQKPIHLYINPINNLVLCHKEVEVMINPMYVSVMDGSDNLTYHFYATLREGMEHL